jgi:hypothetical protein
LGAWSKKFGDHCPRGRTQHAEPLVKTEADGSVYKIHPLPGTRIRYRLIDSSCLLNHCRIGVSINPQTGVYNPTFRNHKQIYCASGNLQPIVATSVSCRQPDTGETASFQNMEQHVSLQGEQTSYAHKRSIRKFVCVYFI